MLLLHHHHIFIVVCELRARYSSIEYDYLACRRCAHSSLWIRAPPTHSCTGFQSLLAGRHTHTCIDFVAKRHTNPFGDTSHRVASLRFLVLRRRVCALVSHTNTHRALISTFCEHFIKPNYVHMEFLLSLLSVFSNFTVFFIYLIFFPYY